MSRSDELRNQLDQVGANWMPWQGEEVVANFGDSAREYQAVRGDRLGLADCSWRDTLVLTGPDAASWLQGLVTSDLRELAREGSGHLTTAVNVVGKLIAEARVLHMPEILMLDLEAGVLQAEFLGHLRRHVITEDVTLLDRSAQTARLGVFGHHSDAFLQQNCQLEHPVGSLEVFGGTWGVLDGLDIIIQRIPLTGERGFYLSCATEDAASIWELLRRADDLVPVGFEALETLRIEAGVPRFGQELTEKRIPLEAGLDRAVSFTKGCYLGQEIIARLDTRGTPARLLRTLVFEDGDVPNFDAKVTVDQKNAGEIVSSTESPRLGVPIALAYIKRAYNALDNVVQVDGRAAKVKPLGYALDSTTDAV